jgi:hypothetical protein
MGDAAVRAALEVSRDYFYNTGRIAKDATLLSTPISRLINNVLQLPGIQSDDLNYVLATLKRIEGLQRYLALIDPLNVILDTIVNELPEGFATNTGYQKLTGIVNEITRKVNEYATLSPQGALAVALWTETQGDEVFDFIPWIQDKLWYAQEAGKVLGNLPSTAPIAVISMLLKAMEGILNAVSDVSQMWNTKMPQEFMDVVHGLPDDFPLKDTLQACFPLPGADDSMPFQRRMLNNLCTANVVVQLFGPILGVENSGPATAIMNLVAMSSFVQGFSHAMDSGSSDYMCGSIADILRGQALNVALNKIVVNEVDMSTVLNVPQLMCAVARNPVLLPGFKALSGHSSQTVYFGSNTYRIVRWGLPSLAGLIAGSPLLSMDVSGAIMKTGIMGMLAGVGISGLHLSQSNVEAGFANVLAGGITSLFHGGPEGKALAQQAFYAFDQNMNAVLVSLMFAGNIDFGSLPDNLLTYVPGFTKARILHKIRSRDDEHDSGKGFRRFVEVERVIVIEGKSYIYGSDLMTSSRDLTHALEADPELDIKEWCDENDLLCTIEDHKTPDADRTLKEENLFEEITRGTRIPTFDENLLTPDMALQGLALALIGGGTAMVGYLSKNDKLKLLNPKNVSLKALFKHVLRDGSAPFMFVPGETLFDFLERAKAHGERPDTITNHIAQMTFNGGYGVIVDVKKYFALGSFSQRSSFKPQLLTKIAKKPSTLKPKPDVRALSIDDPTEDKQTSGDAKMRAQGDTFGGPGAPILGGSSEQPSGSDDDDFIDAAEEPEFQREIEPTTALDADEIREVNRATTQPFTVIEDPRYENITLLKGWGFWIIDILKAIAYCKAVFVSSPINVYEKRRRLDALRSVMLEDRQLRPSLIPAFLGTVQLFNKGAMPHTDDMKRILINSAKLRDDMDGLDNFDGDVCKYYSDNKPTFDKALEIHGRTCTMLADGVKITALSPKDSYNAAPEIQELVDEYEPGGTTLLGDIARGLTSYAGLGGYQIPSNRPIDRDGLNTNNLNDAELKLAALRDNTDVPPAAKESAIRQFKDRIKSYKESEKIFWIKEEKARLKKLAEGEETWYGTLLRKVRGETLPSETLKLEDNNLVTENLADAERQKTLALRLSRRINGQISLANQEKIKGLEQRIQAYKDRDGKYLIEKEKERTKSDDTQAVGNFGVLSTKSRMQGDTTVSASESFIHSGHVVETDDNFYRR